MILLIITLVIAIIIYLLALYFADNDDDRWLVIIGGWAQFAIIAAVLCIIDTKYPTPIALDVYRDKTTLEITYKDSASMDSVVVYKMK